MSLAESLAHTLTLFWDTRWIVLSIILGFGVQAAQYVILKKQLLLPVANTGRSTALTGASGGTSTVAMVACCTYHVAYALPILGLTAAPTFPSEHRILFMLDGLGVAIASPASRPCLSFLNTLRALMTPQADWAAGAAGLHQLQGSRRSHR